MMAGVALGGAIGGAVRGAVVAMHTLAEHLDEQRAGHAGVLPFEMTGGRMVRVLYR